MRLPAILVQLACLGAPASGTANARAGVDPAAVGDLYANAQVDVHSSLTYTHLLLSSSQAQLKRLQWSFQQWGLPSHKEKALRNFRRITRKIERFRTESESVQTAASPFAEAFEKMEKSKRVRKAKKGIPDSVSERISEIEKLRAEYDGDAGRSALARASAALGRLQLVWGPAELKDSQVRVLLLAGNIVEDLRKTRGRIESSLPPKARDKTGAQRKGRSLVALGLEQVAEDERDLATELKRMRIHFQLNNYLKTKSKGGRK